MSMASPLSSVVTPTGKKDKSLRLRINNKKAEKKITAKMMVCAIGELMVTSINYISPIGITGICRMIEVGGVN